ncbi:MAG: sigma-54 dependent transcriptional regulator [Colwellia sp.]
MTMVLIIEDDLMVSETTQRWLSLDGFEVITCADSTKACQLIEKHAIDVVVSDVKMPKLSGLELQLKISYIDAQLPVILMTGHGDIAMAVNAMEQGAYYFIEKPFEPEHLSQIVKRAANKRSLELENKRLQFQLTQVSGIKSRLIGQSQVIENLQQQILSLAGFDASVVINGDTGTGKELVASCLHDYSARCDEPFVAINCGAIPESLLESELFGHEKGAFTGANQTRIGKLEYASKGTLFLDEIESMPMNFQVKLLRALQEKTIERVGSNKSISINPRIVCATKVDLKQLSDQGDFRLDLYYRLKVAEIYIPKLNERLSDVPILFQHFLQQACQKFNIDQPVLTIDELSLLSTKNWHGNIRELKNLSQQFAIVSATGNVALSSLLTERSSESNSHINTNIEIENNEKSLSNQVELFEEHLLRNAMSQCQGSIKNVMELLHISRRNLNLKMQRYDINRSEYLN